MLAAVTAFYRVKYKYVAFRRRNNIACPKFIARPTVRSAMTIAGISKVMYCVISIIFRYKGRLAYPWETLD